MAEAQILPVANLRQHLPRLGEFLSKADFYRLTAILPFFKPQQASKALLSACLDAIAVGRTTQEQMADFRAFRQRLRQASRKAGLKLTLEVDSKKRSEPQSRLCWFTQHTTDRITRSVEEFSEGVIASLETTTTIQSRAMVSVAPTHVRFFVSYDRERDHRPTKDLLNRLQLNFRASKDFDYDIWDDTANMVGEHRANAIAEALHKADFGLLPVSVAWHAKFDPGGSLSVFVTDEGKPVIPVVLQDVVQDLQRLHGLEMRQLFRLELPRADPKSYEECQSSVYRTRFAKSLFQQFEQRLRRWMAAQSPSLSQPSRSQVRPSPGMLDEAIDPDARAEALVQCLEVRPEIHSQADRCPSPRDEPAGHAGCQHGRQGSGPQRHRACGVTAVGP
jgi:hypothetical protein